MFVHDWREDSFNERVSPWPLERLIPVKSQVVIESCRGKDFCHDVVSLRLTRTRRCFVCLFSVFIIIKTLFSRFTVCSLTRTVDPWSR